MKMPEKVKKIYLNNLYHIFLDDWTKSSNRMETNLLLNQEIAKSLLEACMWYQTYALDLIFDSMVKELGHPLWLLLQVLVTCTPTFKIPKQCKARGKVITHDNVIFVLVLIHQAIHNLVSSCMFSILVTYTRIHFNFLQKLGLDISYTKFSFHTYKV